MAYIDKNDNGTTVRELQEMLRAVGLYQGEDILVVPVNGIYGTETEKAVEFFQKTEGLKPTGTVDFETWTALVSMYSKSQRPIAGIVPIAKNVTGLFPGERSNAVTMLQMMLADLSKYYGECANVAVNGFYDKSTCSAVSTIRRINGLTSSDALDIQTWNIIVGEYNSAVNENE